MMYRIFFILYCALYTVQYAVWPKGFIYLYFHSRDGGVGGGGVVVVVVVKVVKVVVVVVVLVVVVELVVVVA